MTGEIQIKNGKIKNLPKDSPDFLYQKVDSFFRRLRGRFSLPEKNTRKTERFKVISRYPEYCEETPEEKKKAAGQQHPDISIYKKRYDSEFMNKLSHFIFFIRRIFKRH